MREDTTIHKGLNGVVVDTTALSQVVEETSSLTYRGYPVSQLTQHCSFEEVAYLLWNGELPGSEQLAAFTARQRAYRDVSTHVVDLIRGLPTDTHPMHILRTAVSLIGATDPDSETSGPDANQQKAERILAQVPTLIAAIHRYRHGLEPIAPDPGQGFSANFFYMTFGEVPDAEVVRCFDVSMILYAEHSFNASTFTARVVASTLSDMYSAVVAAIGALKGPLHGGANEAVMETLDEVGTPANVSDYLDSALAQDRKIMGFGHRLYKHGDSRVPPMREALEDMVAITGDEDLLNLYNAFEEDFVTRTGIYPNVDYPSGPAYHMMGFDTPEFTPLFVMARIAGWTAHIMEQQASNELIRPTSAYVGHEQRDVPARR